MDKNGSTPAPILQRKKMKPFVSTSDFGANAGKVVFVEETQFLTDTVYSAERGNNGKTKGFGSFL